MIILRDHETSNSKDLVMSFKRVAISNSPTEEALSAMLIVHYIIHAAIWLGSCHKIPSKGFYLRFLALPQ